MMPEPITISSTCQNGSYLCTLEVKVQPGQELKLGNQVCTSNNEGYLCGNISLPRKYLPGTQLGTLALFEKGKQFEKDKQVAAQSLHLPATGPEICKWQETIFDKSLAEIKALPPTDRDYALFSIIFSMIEGKLYQKAEALIPQIKSIDGRRMLHTQLASATGNTALYSKISSVDLISVAADRRDANLFDQIIKSSHTTHTNSCDQYHIAKGLIKAGLTAKALPFVLSLPVSGDFLDDSACSSDLVKVDLLLEMNLPNEAERLIRGVLQNQPGKFTNTAIIESLLKVAKTKRDPGLFKLAVDEVRNETKSKPLDDGGAFLWYRVVEAMFEVGLDEPAAKLIDQIQHNAYYKAKALSLYAQKKKSKELFEKAIKIGGKDAANSIAVNMAEAGFIDEAVALAMKNNNVGWEQESAMEKVAIGAVKAKAVDKGMAIVKPFIRGKVSIDGFVSALIEAQYFDQAIEIAETPNLAASVRDHLLSFIVPETIAAKDPHRAIALVESISDQKLKAIVRAMVAAKMCP